MSDTERRTGEKSEHEGTGMKRDPRTGDIMCWKDETKICKCDHPKRGSYCGRFPLPTD